MSAFSQNHATSIKGSKTLRADMHSDMQRGLTNAEGMSMASRPEDVVAGFYSEKKDYDFNNPVRTKKPANGKIATNRITNHQKYLNNLKVVQDPRRGN